MRVAFLTNIVSPHQLPLARHLAKLLGEENFRYITTEKGHSERIKLGWKTSELPCWIIQSSMSNKERDQAQDWRDSADILISGIRAMDLFHKRAQRGLRNYYMSERWFKPPLGMFRMLSPGYFSMCRDFYQLVRSGHLKLLPIGVHAIQDMARMFSLLHGNFRCLFAPPAISIDKHEPMSAVVGCQLNEAMRLWGYFVEPSQGSPVEHRESKMLRILWCGRMLDWKRVDTLVKAAVALLQQGEKLHLLLIGYGAEEARLRRLAGNWLVDNDSGPGISFLVPVEIGAIRGIMRQSDVYVLCSDGGEGWGAVVNEAMAEGCTVIGTHEAGSSATMIEHGVNGWLYPAGNVQALIECLRNEIHRLRRGEPNVLGEAAARTLAEAWSPSAAAQALLQEIQQ